jgi:hypothetical protein
MGQLTFLAMLADFQKVGNQGLREKFFFSIFSLIASLAANKLLSQKPPFSGLRTGSTLAAKDQSCQPPFLMPDLTNLAGFLSSLLF